MLVHLKDLRVHPWTPRREFVAVMYAAPLGRGHVNNRKILEILREQAPDPQNLCLSLELMPMPPNEDEDRWVEASIAYAKSAFAEFLLKGAAMRPEPRAARHDVGRHHDCQSTRHATRREEPWPSSSTCICIRSSRCSTGWAGSTSMSRGRSSTACRPPR